MRHCAFEQTWPSLALCVDFSLCCFCVRQSQKTHLSQNRHGHSWCQHCGWILVCAPFLCVAIVKDSSGRSHILVDHIFPHTRAISIVSAYTFSFDDKTNRLHCILDDTPRASPRGHATPRHLFWCGYNVFLLGRGFDSPRRKP